jgi:DNA polymerase III delta subunit
MKIIVLHGDDTIKLYERLTKFTEEAKKRQWELTDYSFNEISNQTLFDSEKFFILRDYKKLDKTELKQLDKYLGNLIIYHEGKIPALTLKTYNASKVEVFELPQKLWGFLDNISLKGLHEVIRTEAVEMVFALLASRMKDLYWAKVGTPPYPSWRVSKLKSQGSKFSEETLKEVIQEMAEIDVNSKLGKENLLSSLDMLMVKKLS